MAMSRNFKFVGGLGYNIRDHLSELGLGEDADFKLKSKEHFKLQSGAKRTRWTYSLDNEDWKGTVVATTKKGAGTRTLEASVYFKDRTVEVKVERPQTSIYFGGSF